MRLRTPLCGAVAVAALAAPSEAAAVKDFTGQTQQHRVVDLRIGDDNLLHTARINWITRNCSQSGSRFQNMTRFRKPYDESTPESFRHVGTETVTDDEGRIRSRVRVTFTGRHFLDPANPAAEKWVGTISASVVVRRRGRVIDRCRLRSTTWKAGLAPA
jgi:hypothetical protein